MSPDYSAYSQEELLEALDSIDKDLYPENYETLALELSKRNTSSKSEVCTNESQLVEERPSHINNTPCSFKRITTVIFLGFLGSIPVVAQAESSKLSSEGFFSSALMLIMMGLPLVIKRQLT